MCKYKNKIPQILDGDTDLYKEIVVEYKNNIFAIVYSMIRDYHTAEDLTQDVFIDGYIKLNSLSNYDKLGAWLMKIAKNKCYNYLRREGFKYKQECEFEDYLPNMQVQTPENYIIDKYERDALEKAIKNLPDLYKNVTILFYFEEHSQKEIAEILAIPVSTVKNRLHDARLKLKKELGNVSTTVKLSDDAKFEEKVMTVINNILPKMRDENFLKLIDEEIEKFGKNKNALGMLYYWRGVSQIENEKQDWINDKLFDEAKKDFEKAAEYINNSNKYKGAAVSGIKIVNVLKDNDKYMPFKFSTAGEVLKEYDNKIDWLCNPGFGMNIGDFKTLQTAFSQIYLWASRVNKHLLDLNMIVGEIKTDESNTGTITLVSKGETSTILAGTFENCLHLRVKAQDLVFNKWQLNSDIWYAKDVGLIKFYNDGIDIAGIPVAVNYELDSYKINGENGYFPLAVGNSWSYKNTAILEDTYYQFNEYEVVSITDSQDGKYINLSAANCFKYKII